MDVQFIASIAVIAPDPSVSRRFYVDALGLPLMGSEDDYLHSEDIDGSKSFGVWPLTQAAQACFGTPDWPADRPVPQASIEFEVADGGPGCGVAGLASRLRQGSSPPWIPARLSRCPR